METPLLASLVILHEGKVFINLDFHPTLRRMYDIRTTCYQTENDAIQINDVHVITMSDLLSLCTGAIFPPVIEGETEFRNKIVSEIETLVTEKVNQALTLSPVEVLERIYQADPVIKQCVDAHEEACLLALSAIVKQTKVLVVLDSFVVSKRLVTPSFQRAVSLLPKDEESTVYILPAFFPHEYSDAILEYTAEVYQWFVLKNWRINVRFLQSNDTTARTRLQVQKTVASELFLQTNHIDGEVITGKESPCDVDQLFSKGEKVLHSQGKQWKAGVLGGTFDHLHAGHLLMLATASQSIRDTLHIGVTGPEMLVNKKYAEQLETIERRMEHLREILSEQHPSLQLNVFPLHDPYGPTLTAPDIDAIIVSEETRSFTEEKINKVREENGLRAFEILSVPLLSPPDGFAGADGPGKLSSTQLRRMQQERQTKE